MNSKVQRLILLGTLGVGYYIYRNALREVIYQNHNALLNTALFNQMRSQNYTVVGENRVLIGNPINQSYDPNRERIVILGGGIVGLTTAYYLAKLHKYDVILIDQNETFDQPAGFGNGIFSPSGCIPQTDGSFILNAFKSVYSSDSPVKFSWRGLFERNITIWLSNYFLNLTGDSHLQGTKKLAYLAKLSAEEMDLLNTELDIKEHCQVVSKGTLHLYEKEADLKKHKSYIDVLRHAPISVKELDRDQLVQQEPVLDFGEKKFESGYLGTQDACMNLNRLCRKLGQIAEINGVTLIPSTEFHKFLIHKDENKIVGVVTSQGIILCDRIVVSGGVKSKDIVHKLGVRLPILGSQEYTITADMPENKQLSHSLTDEKSKSILSPLKGRYYISGGNDVGYEVFPIRDARVSSLINSTKEKIGEFNSERVDVWANIKSLSADDVPIIGALPQYDNIYVNTGHGNKGLTLAFGSGKVLSDIIEGKVNKNVESDYSLSRFYLV